jgi:microcystin-dependent protein
MKAVLLAAAVITAAFAAPASANPDPYVGEIMLFSGPYCPKGWYEADGRLVPIRDNQILFAILYNNYGGDGRTNFALPDLRKEVPAAAADERKFLRYCIAWTGYWPERPN